MLTSTAVDMAVVGSAGKPVVAAGMAEVVIGTGPAGMGVVVTGTALTGMAATAGITAATAAVGELAPQ